MSTCIESPLSSAAHEDAPRPEKVLLAPDGPDSLLAPLLADAMKLLDVIELRGRTNGPVDASIMRAADALRGQVQRRMKRFAPSAARRPTDTPAASGAPGVRGSSIQIANGHYFDYLKTDVSKLDIESVAHALSHICRFTGHCTDFYSVAQHCVLMSYAVPAPHALWALMHEAGEPVCGDMNKPLKLLLDEFDRMEGVIERAVLRKFGLDPDAKPSTIKHFDLVLLLTERRDLMPKVRATRWNAYGIACEWEPIPEQETDFEWRGLSELRPLPQAIVPMDSKSAKNAFIARFIELAFNPQVEQEGTLAWSARHREGQPKTGHAPMPI